MTNPGTLEPQPRSRLATVSTLSVGQKLGWAVGTHGTSSMFAILTFYLLFYMTNILGINIFIAGWVIFLSKAYDFVTDPLVGHLSDRTKSRYGRRRPYLFFGALASFAAVAALFNPPALGDTGIIVYVTLILLLFATGYTLFNVPYLTMPAEITPHYHERTVLMSYRMVFIATAGLITIGGGAQFIGNFPEVEAYSLIGWVMGGLIGLAMLTTFLATQSLPQLEVTDTTKFSVGEQLRLILENRPFFIYLLAKLGGLMAQASITSSLLYFGTYVLMRQDELIFAFGVSITIGQLGAIPLWRVTSRFFGKRKMFMVASIGYALTTLTFLLSTAAEPGFILNFRVVVLGAFTSGILMMGFAILPDTMDYDRRRTGIGREGIYAGIYGTMEKLAQAIGPLIFANFLGVMGFVSAKAGETVEQPESAITTMTLGVAVIPSVCSLSAAVAMWFYDLSEEKLKAAGKEATP